MSDEIFFLSVGIILTAILVVGVVVGLAIREWLSPTTPEISEADLRWLRTRLSDEELAANNRAYKEFCKRSDIANEVNDAS